MRWLITEKCEYVVEADTREEAEDFFLANGPSLPRMPDDAEGAVAFSGVIERMVEEADTSG
jgi:hypothetical protein